MGKDKAAKKPAPAAASKKGISAARQQPSTPPSPPAWPPFKPALPVTDLDFVSPAPGFEDKVVLVRNFWPRNLCRDYVTFLQGLPLTTTPGKPKRGDAVRVNDRFQVHDPAFSHRLWVDTGLREAILDQSAQHLWYASNPLPGRLVKRALTFAPSPSRPSPPALSASARRDTNHSAHLQGGKPLALNPNIRVYRYSPNMFFDCHYDDSNMVTLPTPDEPDRTTTGKTTWTLLLYLTSSAEGCQGGETAFYPHDRKTEKEAIVVAPETGMLLLHKHGDECLLHEGREVTTGHKWILRTDLVVEK